MAKAFGCPTCGRPVDLEAGFARPVGRTSDRKGKCDERDEISVAFKENESGGEKLDEWRQELWEALPGICSDEEDRYGMNDDGNIAIKKGSCNALRRIRAR